MPKPSDQIEDRAVQIPETPTSTKPATVFAEALINGHTTTVRASVEEAEARGWKVLGLINPSSATPAHKSRTATPPESPEPSPAGASEPKTKAEDITPAEEHAALLEALRGFTVPQLREQAADIGLEGISSLRKEELIGALVEARAEED